MMDSSKRLVKSLLGIICIVGYILFYVKHTTITSPSDIDVMDFLSGLGAVMSIYLILLIAFATKSFLLGFAVAIGAVFALDKFETKLGITVEGENKIFAVVGVIMTFVIIGIFVSAIKEMNVDMELERLEREQKEKPA